MTGASRTSELMFEENAVQYGPKGKGGRNQKVYNKEQQLVGQAYFQKNPRRNGRQITTHGGWLSTFGRKCSHIREMCSRLSYSRRLRSNRMLRSHHSHYSGKKKIQRQFNFTASIKSV